MSPADISIMDYFHGYPRQAELFLAIQEMCESIGPVRMEVMKSGISFATRHKFAWVWLPQRYELRTPEGSLVLSLGLDRRITHPRIKEAVNPYRHRWTHHLVIRDRVDLDDELREWLAEAYQFSSRASRGKRSQQTDDES